MNRMWFAAILAFLVFLVMPARPGEAARCVLSKGAGAVPIVEKNLSMAARGLSGAKAQEIQALRSQLSGIAQAGKAFSAKAAPIEQECKALTLEFKKLKAAKKKRDAVRKPVREQLKAISAEWKRVFKPRSAALKKESADYKSQGCGRTFNVPKEKAAFDRCEAWLSSLRAKKSAYRRDVAQSKARWKKLKARLKAIDQQYENVRKPLKARYEKYKAALKTYNAGRKTWSGKVRGVWAKVNAIQREAFQAKAKARQEKATRQARLEMAKKLRGQVKGLQTALRRLNRSMLSDASQRKQWERATSQAMENAWNRGKGMIVDESLGVLGKRLEGQLSSANKQIQSAVVRLSGEKNTQRRERLHAAIKLMQKQREEIKRAKTLVVDRLKDAKQITDAVDYASSNPGDLEKSLRGTYDIVKTTLGDPKVQKALKIGGKYAKGAGYAQSIVDSSFDITTEIVSWRRINQLNKNSDEYLKAVNGLKSKMESKMKKIHELEGKK